MQYEPDEDLEYQAELDRGLGGCAAMLWCVLGSVAVLAMIWICL